MEASIATEEAARKFHFLRELASGDSGSVYLAKVLRADGSSRLVAVKLPHERRSETEAVPSRMRDEARLLGWLRHRNIVEVLDFALIDGRPAVIMEHLEAIDLRALLRRSDPSGATPAPTGSAGAGPPRREVPLGVALEICASVASALDAAYNRPPYAGEKPLRILHRALKPSNVMVDARGVVKVLDFGAGARSRGRQGEAESPASDIYSLGSLLYEMLALEKLDEAKLRRSDEDRFADLLEERTPRSKKVAAQLGELLRAMLSYDASDRPTAADLVTRMRTLARQVGGPSIEEWASRTVPALLAVARAEQAEEGSLVGQILTEGARASARSADARDTSDPTEPSRTEDADTVEYTAEYSGTGHDDAAVDEAVLPALSETDELGAYSQPIGSDDETVTRGPAEPARSFPTAVGLLASAALLLVVSGVTLVAALIIGGAGLAALTLSSAPLGAPSPVETPAADPVEPAVRAVRAGAVFASLMDGTKRMTVRCDQGSASGRSEVALDAASPGGCTVVAIDGSRRRRTAVVPAVESRRYECFRGDEDRCD